MSQLSENIYTDFIGQIFRELFQFKTRSLLLGHPVCEILHLGPVMLQSDWLLSS